jgi:hypothetical protein
MIMADYRLFRINDELEIELTLDSGHIYLLPDGRQLPVRQEAAWCRNCRTVVAAEFIPSLEAVNEQIRQCNDPSDKLHKCFGRSAIDEIRSQSRLTLEWLVTRASPAHCLKCEGTDIVHIHTSSGDMVDTISGTRIRCLTDYGHAALVFRFVRYLTPEGLLME